MNTLGNESMCTYIPKGQTDLNLRTLSSPAVNLTVDSFQPLWVCSVLLLYKYSYLHVPRV